MTSDLQEVSDLIGEIYDCALDVSRWPHVLARICDATGAFCAEIQEYNPASGVARFVAHHGWSTESIELTKSYGHLSPALPVALAAPLGEPLWADRDGDFDSFRRSTFYRLCLEKDGHRDYIHTPLVRNVTLMSGWGFSRNTTMGTFAEQHVEFARLLTPHVRRALLLHGLLEEKAAATMTLQAVVDAFVCAAIVVDLTGTVMLANRLAEDELAKGTLLRMRGRRVASPVQSVSRLIASMSGASTGRGQDAEVVVEGDGLVQVTWVKLAKDGPCLLLARKPAAELVTPLGTAMRLFGLTHGETQVLAALLQGRTLDEVADWLGVSRSTVKTHLDGIFAKTGERRQRDLVRRVIGLKTPVG